MYKDLFLLDPKITYLNHGSFGACPRPVFEVYQAWQRKIESEPVQFLGVELDNNLLHARKLLGDYLNVSSNNLVYITNATYGINLISRSLKLNKGEEILTTNQEYGACDYAWDFVCTKSGALYKQQPIRFPVTSNEDIIEQFWQGVSTKTRVLFLSHITSPTALIMPIEQICLRAKKEGILTVIDGAHAPGQINIDLQSIQADFYVGNCHKWMMSPKGAGFLYAHEDVQKLLDPLIVSWGYQSLESKPKESTFIDLMQWTGTRDPSAALSVPAAIEFMETYKWENVRAECHALLQYALEELHKFTQIEPLYPPSSSLYKQMGVVPIPRVKDINMLKSRLFNEFNIEVPCIEWNGHHLIRVSVQGYNNAHDIDYFLQSLKILIPLMCV